MPPPAVGFIGLGKMGAPMARRLLRAGVALRAYDIRPEAIRALEAAGARPAASPAGAAEGAGVVFTSLPGPKEVEEVTLRPGGLAEAMAPATIHIDLSTSLPSTTRKVGAALGERAVEMLDAPVAGGAEGAEAGRLTLMVGGARKAFLRAKPLLDLVGGDPSKVFHVGPLGAGHAAKLANNLIHLTGFVVSCELLVLAAKAGLDLDFLYEVVCEGPWSVSFRNKVPRVLRRQFLPPRSTLEMCHKDVELGVALAKELGVPLTLAPAALQLYQAARALGWGELDGAAVVQVVEAYGGVTVRSAGAS